MVRFAASEGALALLLVPALALLFWFGVRRRRAALELFGDSELVRKLAGSVSVTARRVKGTLTLAAVALIAIALTRPQFGNRVETVEARGQDIMIAVDLSQSMRAEDVAPSRLERARLAILRLMSQLDGDRVGLVAFAGDAFVQSPLTVDYSAAGLFLGAMDPDMMPVPGTDLGEALRVSLDALEEAREARVLIVVTDAEDHEVRWGDQVERAREMGVALYFVVIGTTEGAPIPVFDAQGNRQGFLRDEDDAVVTTRLGEETLRQLARQTDATIVQAGSGGEAFDDLVDEIAAGEGEALDARQITQFEEQYQVFLGLAFLLLLAEVAISDRRPTREAWLGRFE